VVDQREELPILPFGNPIGFVPAASRGVTQDYANRWGRQAESAKGVKFFVRCQMRYPVHFLVLLFFAIHSYAEASLVIYRFERVVRKTFLILYIVTLSGLLITSKKMTDSCRLS